MIKVNITGEKRDKAIVKYPYVGQYKNLVVLFNGPGQGIALSDTEEKVGLYSADWNEKNFKMVPSVEIVSELYES